MENNVPKYKIDDLKISHVEKEAISSIFDKLNR